jgi:VanZ family protein
VCLLYGISDEVHQIFISQRHPSLFDVITDLGGAILGVLLWTFTINNRIAIFKKKPCR